MNEIISFFTAITLAVSSFFGGLTLGAPTQNTFEKSIIPLTDSTYYLGTTTPSTVAWAGGIFDQLCLTGDSCVTTWPSGSPGSTSAFDIATTSDIAVPQVAYITKVSGKTTLGSVATGTVSAGTGISLDNTTRSVLGGSLQITNSGVTSNVAGSGISVSGATGAVTISTNGLNAIATTSDIAVPQLVYVSKVSGLTTFASVATTTLTATSPLSLSQPVVKVGGSNSVLTISTTTNTLFTGTPGQVLGYTNLGWTGVATTTAGTGLSYDGTSFNNAGVLSLAGTDGITFSASTGAITARFANQFATSSLGSISDVLYLTKLAGQTTVSSVATGTVSSANSALTVTSGRAVLGGSLTLTVATTTNTMYTGTPGQVLTYTNLGWTGAATTTAGTGLTYTGTAFNVNTSQNISTLSNLTTNGFVITSGGTGALSVQAFPATVAQGGTNKTAYDSSMLIASDNAGTTLVATGTPTLAGFIATSTTASSTIRWGLGVNSIAVTNLVSCDTIDTDSNGQLKCGSDAQGSGAAPNSKWATSTQPYGSIFPSGNTGAGDVRVGIGTTTPRWNLQIASSTGPQFALSDASQTSSHWVMRSLKGALYIGTSTPDTFATSSAPFTWLRVEGDTPTSTFAYGIASNDLRVTKAPTFDALTSAIILTGSAGGTAEYAGTSCTNQFVRSLDAVGAATCATVSAGDVSLANLSATDTTLTFSGTYNGSTARTIGLNLGNANTWTALQIFNGNATSSQLTVTGTATSTNLQGSVFVNGMLGIGTTATTTIRGNNATSTFSNGVLTDTLRSTRAPTFDPLTSAIILTDGSGNTAEYAGTTCTNQFVRSLSALGAATCATVSAGDVSLANLTATDSTLTFSGTYNGSTARTIGLNLGNANTWTVLQTFNAGAGTPGIVSNALVGIGTTTPRWALQVASSTGPQFALSDTSLTSNHWSFRSINSYLYISTSSPASFATSTFAAVQITKGGLLMTYAQQPATTTTIKLDWENTPNQVEYRIGTSATTISLVNATTASMWGSTKRVWVCNPGVGTAGTITWQGVEWIGTAPTQTTTVDQCDLYSFNVTRATSSNAYKVAGAASTGFQ